LPFDQHQLIALVAPRGYHGGDGVKDAWADPRGSWLALVEASKVWALFGAPPALNDAMPPVGDLLSAGPVACHVRAGGHDLTALDWKLYLDHADLRSGARRPNLNRPRKSCSPPSATGSASPSTTGPTARRIGRLLLFFLTVAIPSVMPARDWHVSAMGFDSADGTTSATAFRSLQKAADLVAPATRS